MFKLTETFGIREGSSFSFFIRIFNTILPKNLHLTITGKSERIFFNTESSFLVWAHTLYEI